MRFLYSVPILALMLAACSAPLPPSVPGSTSASSGSSAGSSSSGIPGVLTTPPVVLKTGDWKPGTPVTGGLAEQYVDVVMDGWSYKASDGNKLLWQDDTEATGSLTLSPVTADQVSALKTTPEVMTVIGARMVSPAADLDCSASGCSGSHPFNVEWVTDPASVPVFGPSYDGYGIESLAYAARIKVSPEASSVSFTLVPSDYKEDVALLPWVTVMLLGGGGTDTGSESGFGANRALLGSAFALLFPLEPAWLTGRQYTREAAVSAADKEQALTVGEQLPATSTAGLTKAWTGTESLTPSALTYFSSPTTGCGLGSLCVPVPIEGKESVTQEALALCSSTGKGPVPGKLANTTLEVNVPAPTNQYGMWGISSLSDMKDIPQSGGANGGGLPPSLVEGATTMYWGTLSFGNPESGQLVDIVGAAGLSRHTTTLEELAGLEVDGATWRACP